MKTGDEAVIRKSPQETEREFIVNSLKELIKVKGSSLVILVSWQLCDVEFVAMGVPSRVLRTGVVPPHLPCRSYRGCLYSAGWGSRRATQSLHCQVCFGAVMTWQIRRDIQIYVEQHKSRHK
jgi:hypothetical protein